MHFINKIIELYPSLKIAGFELSGLYSYKYIILIHRIKSSACKIPRVALGSKQEFFCETELSRNKSCMDWCRELLM